MRRLFWLGVGAAAGVSGTVWAERQVKQRLEALQPDHLVVTAGNKAKSVGRSVVDAVSEGRGAMRDREAELRDQYDGGRGAQTQRHVTTSPTRPMTGSWQSGAARHRR